MLVAMNSIRDLLWIDQCFPHGVCQSLLSCMPLKSRKNGTDIYAFPAWQPYPAQTATKPIASLPSLCESSALSLHNRRPDMFFPFLFSFGTPAVPRERTRRDWLSTAEQQAPPQLPVAFRF